MTVYLNGNGSFGSLGQANFVASLFSFIPGLSAGKESTQATLNTQLLLAQEEAKRTQIRAVAVIGSVAAAALLIYFLAK